MNYISLKKQEKVIYEQTELKVMIWRYYMSYWNNRRISSSNDGLPPKVKRDRFYAALSIAA